MGERGLKQVAELMEYDAANLAKVAAGKRKNAVVGAGPAGCEAALSAMRRGASVVLLEAGSNAGGRARVAGLAPHRATWLRYADYLHEAVTAEKALDARPPYR